MIAPISPHRHTSRSAHLARVRAMLAATLLSNRPAAAPAPVDRWKAWLFAAWAAVATGFYFVTLLRGWQP